MPVETRYQAFLSYSHADREVAQWLHRALETFRIPAKLVGQVTAVGAVPSQLGRIFKDREELAASDSLSAEIDAALGASGALIVICSRAAAQSRWVNEEIRNFKHQHGAGRVFAVIADGEPFATGMAGREADECFPSALRFTVDAAGIISAVPTEPIAADLRKQGDGRRLATLKIIAGLTGLKLDDLVRREAQRRAQRATAVAVASAVLAIIMTGLSVVALRARNDAQRQHEQAEGLIEFMLVDLRKKLEPVGRLDVLDAVGEKALAHYDAQAGESLDANSLGHRSRALHLIGEIRQNRGKLDEALVAFQRAASTTSQLLQRAPNDAQRIFDHAQSVFWVGLIGRQRGQHADAERAFQQYRVLAKQLVELDPQKPEWQVETAYAAQNIGVVLLDAMRPKEALPYLQQAREVVERLVSSRPELADDLAHTYGWMSLAHERLGSFELAIALQHDKQRLFNSVPDADKNQKVQRGLQNALGEIGRMEMARGQHDVAESQALLSVERATRMTANDPENLFWLGQFCDAQVWLADAQVALGKPGSARDTLAKVEPALQRLLARDKTKIDWQIGTQGAYLNLRFRLAGADRNRVVERMKAYVADVHAFINAGKKLRPAQLLPYAEAELQLGHFFAATGDRETAQAHWRVVVDLLSPFERDANFHLLTLLARARHALGGQEDVRALKETITASAYRHPNYAEFIDEWARGTGSAPSNKGKKS